MLSSMVVVVMIISAMLMLMVQRLTEAVAIAANELAPTIAAAGHAYADPQEGEFHRYGINPVIGCFTMQPHFFT